MEKTSSIRPRIVITGVGVIASNGIGKEVFREAIRCGVSGIKPVTAFDTSAIETHIAGQVLDFEPELYIDKKEIRRMERFTQMAVAASKMAILDAKLNLDEEDLELCGVVLGTGMGSFDRTEKECRTLISQGIGRVSPSYMATSIPNAAAAQVSISNGFKGYLGTTLASCAAGIQSVGESYFHMQRGLAEIMLAGASEASISPLCFGSFSNLKALSTLNENPQGAARPFSLDRDGFVMSEGAGIVVLETLSHALARNAFIYAEIVGFGACSDAFHITSPDPDGDGMRRAMELALKDGDISKSSIDYINAHGSGTKMNDVLETMAIKKVFGERAYAIPVSSTKSMTGHSLSSAGAIELIATVLAMNAGFIPPTINLNIPDPELDLDYVPNQARIKEIRTAMLNSFGFGGQNACLIVHSYPSNE
ncbi:MAG: beta-ketoacyl-ACP synthase II [Erysipelotrichaceae bacterium]